MKQINFLNFQIFKFSNFLILFLLLFFSCKKSNTDTCKNKCQNKSTCIDGTCICLTGYTGKYCEKKYSYRFLGVYSVKDEGKFSYFSKSDTTKIVLEKNYTSVITQGDSAHLVNISNYFGDDRITAVAKVDANSITIIRGLKFYYNNIPYPIFYKNNNTSIPYFPIDHRLNFDITDTSYSINSKGDTLNHRITKCYSIFTKQ